MLWLPYWFMGRIIRARRPGRNGARLGADGESLSAGPEDVISWGPEGRMAKKRFTLSEARKIGKDLGLSWKKVDLKQFHMGLNVELEHGTRNLVTNVTDDDELLTAKIALAHLAEFPDYYTRLDKLEKAAEKYWKQ